jgi:uncharacterized repeat protein (TIGR03847 family)
MAFYEDDEALPVTRITAGAVGQPGQRTFILQAQYGEELISWVIDKAHAADLSNAIPALLADVENEFPELDAPLVAAEPRLDLQEPLMPEFRVGAIGLDYDRLHDLVVFTLTDAAAQELPPEDMEILVDEVEAVLELQVYVTRGQALLLGQQAGAVVSAGRPLCPVCGDPLDEFGHFCLPASARRTRGVLLH